MLNSWQSVHTDKKLLRVRITPQTCEHATKRARSASHKQTATRRNLAAGADRSAKTPIANCSRAQILPRLILLDVSERLRRSDEQKFNARALASLIHFFAT